MHPYFILFFSAESYSNVADAEKTGDLTPLDTVLRLRGAQREGPSLPDGVQRGKWGLVMGSLRAVLLPSLP